MRDERLERVYRKRKDVVSRSIAGEKILVPIRQELADMQRIFSLNSVADCLWEEIDGSKTVKELISNVLDRFDAESEAAETDVNSFLEDLLEADLIEVAD